MPIGIDIRDSIPDCIQSIPECIGNIPRSISSTLYLGMPKTHYRATMYIVTFQTVEQRHCNIKSRLHLCPSTHRIPTFKIQKSHNSRWGSYILNSEHILKASLRDTITEATRQQNPEASSKGPLEQKENQTRSLTLSVSFFGIKPTSIVRSVHGAFQHSDGSGGDSPIVREETLDPSRLVWFERRLVSPCPRSQKPSH